MKIKTAVTEIGFIMIAIIIGMGIAIGVALFILLIIYVADEPNKTTYTSSIWLFGFLPSLQVRMKHHRKLQQHWKLSEGKIWCEEVRNALAPQIEKAEDNLLVEVPKKVLEQVEELAKGEGGNHGS